jgi:Zn-dependent protease with chaperone function
MMGLAVISLVLVGFVAAALSLAIGAVLPWATRVLAGLEPRRRSRVIAALMAAPAVGGLVILALAFGPCLETALRGLPDACERHGGPHLLLCLQRPAHPTTLAFVVALAMLARLAVTATRVLRGALATSRVAHALSRGSRGRSSDGYYVVPGRASFTAGWPRSEIFVGEEVLATVAPKHLAVVVAHERTHQRQFHVLEKLAARALVACHVPFVGRRLVLEVDAALEESCDLEAAREAGDPLLVAESLVAVARLGVARPAGALAGFTDSADLLSRRIDVLCVPPWTTTRRSRAVPGGLLVGVAALALLAVVFDQRLHDVTEALLQVIGS